MCAVLHRKAVRRRRRWRTHRRIRRETARVHRPGDPPAPTAGCPVGRHRSQNGKQQFSGHGPAPLRCRFVSTLGKHHGGPWPQPHRHPEPHLGHRRPPATAPLTSATAQDITLICRRGIASITTTPAVPVTSSTLGNSRAGSSHCPPQRRVRIHRRPRRDHPHRNLPADQPQQRQVTRRQRRVHRRRRAHHPVDVDRCHQPAVDPGPQPRRLLPPARRPQWQGTRQSPAAPPRARRWTSRPTPTATPNGGSSYPPVPAATTGSSTSTTDGVPERVRRVDRRRSQRHPMASRHRSQPGMATRGPVGDPVKRGCFRHPRARGNRRAAGYAGSVHAGMGASGGQLSGSSSRQKVNFNRGWTFARSERDGSPGSQLRRLDVGPGRVPHDFDAPYDVGGGNGRRSR